ncbi:hypothetical protein P0E95_003250 [Vibrio metschnikovii]|uniref:hypothetical protein n=1 Tax=Vibrio metschnikovii TaxID=28172 RepID=UPI001C2F5AFE|nr:hypothetical protein [Vibrio metschnikovii]EKO3566865.1 hypothetical protein [Vibrio metschnikovii]EKO3770558.1 hypothetical protein [Vibrio metschnikovii]
MSLNFLELVAASNKAQSLVKVESNNVRNTKPFLGQVCMVRKEEVAVPVIHVRTESGQRETYLLSTSIAEQLPTTAFQVKLMFTMHQQDNRVRFIFVNEQSDNSWEKSKLEALRAGQQAPILVHTDHDAKVYTYEVLESEDIFEIEVASMNKGLESTFDHGRYIDTLGHPLIQEIRAKRGESIVAVDEVNLDKTDAEHLQKAEVVDSSALDARNRLDFQEIELEIENPSIPELDLDTLELDDMFA